MTVFDDK